MTLKGFQLDLGESAGFLLNDFEGSFRKYHLTHMQRENFSKSFINSCSSIFHWIGANSNPFSSTLISASDRTLWVRLKIVYGQKCPLRQPKLVISTSCTFYFWHFYLTLLECLTTRDLVCQKFQNLSIF